MNKRGVFFTLIILALGSQMVATLSLIAPPEPYFEQSSILFNKLKSASFSLNKDNLSKFANASVSFALLKMANLSQKKSCKFEINSFKKLVENGGPILCSPVSPNHNYPLSYGESKKLLSFNGLSDSLNNMYGKQNISVSFSILDLNLSGVYFGKVEYNLTLIANFTSGSSYVEKRFFLSSNISLDGFPDPSEPSRAYRFNESIQAKDDIKFSQLSGVKVCSGRGWAYGEVVSSNPTKNKIYFHILQSDKNGNYHFPNVDAKGYIFVVNSCSTFSIPSSFLNYVIVSNSNIDYNQLPSCASDPEKKCAFFVYSSSGNGGIFNIENAREFVSKGYYVKDKNGKGFLESLFLNYPSTDEKKYITYVKDTPSISYQQYDPNAKYKSVKGLPGCDSSSNCDQPEVNVSSSVNPFDFNNLVLK